MSSWPPESRTSPVSYVAVAVDGETIEASCTGIDFLGVMSAVNPMGGGVVQVRQGLQEFSTDPESPQAGDAWILKEATRKIAHVLPHFGLGMATVTYRFYLKYRTSLNTTLSFEFT